MSFGKVKKYVVLGPSSPELYDQSIMKANG